MLLRIRSELSLTEKVRIGVKFTIKTIDCLGLSHYLVMLAVRKQAEGGLISV